ncbi:serine hydroxymethyltransferase, partial [Arthrobacter sp. MYb227]
TRGFSEAAFVEVADIIAETLIAGTQENHEAALAALKDRVTALANAHPLYPELAKLA